MLPERVGTYLPAMQCMQPCRLQRCICDSETALLLICGMFDRVAIIWKCPGKATADNERCHQQGIWHPRWVRSEKHNSSMGCTMAVICRQVEGSHCGPDRQDKHTERGYSDASLAEGARNLQGRWLQRIADISTLKTSPRQYLQRFREWLWY